MNKSLTKPNPKRRLIEEARYSAHLRLSEARLCDDGVEMLVSGSTQNMEFLYLSRNGITVLGMGYFSVGRWDSLKELYLQSGMLAVNMISDQGCKYLSQTDMPALQKLNLAGNMIGDSGASHLSKACWESLAELDLSNNYDRYSSQRGGQHFEMNHVKQAGLRKLVRADWKRISTIEVDKYKVEPHEFKVLLLSERRLVDPITLRQQRSLHYSHTKKKRNSLPPFTRNRIGLFSECF